MLVNDSSNLGQVFMGYNFYVILCNIEHQIDKKNRQETSSNEPKIKNKHNHVIPQLISFDLRQSMPKKLPFLGLC